MQLERNNNFDLLRLFAAISVMLWHGAEHLGVFNEIYYLLACMYHFPGVPIFFTISGFLISHSLEKGNFNLKVYTKNRIIRIFPALWVCTILTAVLFIFFGKVIVLKDMLIWLLAQFTFLQFYAPESLKTWGVGHPNGSLWTISVELQFYFVLPFILFVARKIKRKSLENTFLISLFLVSILFRHLVVNGEVVRSYPILTQLSGVFILYYLHFFLTGILLYKNFDSVKRFIVGNAGYYLVAYTIYVLLFKVWLGLYDSPYSINFWGIIANTLLSILILSFAFSYQDLSNQILQHHDISYGIYIYHMPVVNIMIALDRQKNLVYLLFMAFFSVSLAFISWKFIEQKIMLSFKNKT